jgi:hypothetical protein
MPDMGVPPFVLGLANAGIVVALYSLLGLAGYWFAHKLDCPASSAQQTATGGAGSLSRWGSACYAAWFW